MSTTREPKTWNDGDQDLLIEMVKSIIPPLDSNSHKGQAGRIGVIGGSKEYTGAPYFSAISALRVGADLAHIFCSSTSSLVIKSYSPELIVHPHLDDADAVEEISKWLPRLHSIVIGPGLGRDEKVLNVVKEIIAQIKVLDIPMVIDAVNNSDVDYEPMENDNETIDSYESDDVLSEHEDDGVMLFDDGIYMIQSDVGMITKVPDVILTPNCVEFERLYEKVLNRKPDIHNLSHEVKLLSISLGNLTILCKGKVDIISDGQNIIECNAEGSPRRCGGQGDLLSGSLGVFIHWARKAMRTEVKHQLLSHYGPTMTAAYAAALFTRKCNHLAFLEKGRSTLTSDMVNKICLAFHNLYGKSES
ncbi:ATP-dependent (S)-NAD(P)H-hydrate dehydratase [Nymphon striatum]|nr:ATP-dependent (S)-NAD(P)H-hydrate dehydratase [Nymphon striatum]